MKSVTSLHVSLINQFEKIKQELIACPALTYDPAIHTAMGLIEQRKVQIACQVDMSYLQKTPAVQFVIYVDGIAVQNLSSSLLLEEETERLHTIMGELESHAQMRQIDQENQARDWFANRYLMD